MVLKSYAKILKNSNDLRWRVEHAQCVSQNDLHYFRDFNIIPSVQPTHATSDFNWAIFRLGKQRLSNCYQYHSLYLANQIISLGTDFPVEKINPLNTFYAAVFRKNNKGEFEKVSWEKAYEVFSQKLNNSIDNHGPDSTVWWASARVVTEANYLLQKFDRTVVGTNNIDNCSRT